MAIKTEGPCCLTLLALALAVWGCGFDDDPLDNERPSASLEAPERADVGEWIALDAAGSSDADGFLVRYLWELGDETPLLMTEGPSLTYAYDSPGVYTITLTVVDDGGGKNSAQHVITVR